MTSPSRVTFIYRVRVIVMRGTGATLITYGGIWNFAVQAIKKKNVQSLTC